MTKELDPHKYVSDQPRISILLMRHPQTVANEQARYLGQVNVPLSELGQWQLARAIQGVIAFKPEVIISSPLERCLAIAEPAAGALELPVKIDDRLQELGFGALEGLNYKEVVERGLSFPWGETAINWPVEGAESLGDFAARVAEAADDIKALERRVAVIIHGGVVRAMTSYWMGIPEDKLWSMMVRNVESAVFSNDGDYLFLERFGLEPEWLSADL